MFIVTHGFHKSTKTPIEFIENIVYGNPRIDAVLVGSRLVAILEYPSDQYADCIATSDRIRTFNFGVKLVGDDNEAEREFGIWVRHYAPGTVVGLTPSAA